MINKVKEFNRVFDLNNPIDTKHIELKAMMLESELHEYEDAGNLKEPDNDPLYLYKTKIEHFEAVLTEQFDACLDIPYVALGVAILHDIEVDLKKMINGMLPMNASSYTIIHNETLFNDISASIALYEANALDGNDSDLKRYLGAIFVDVVTLACHHGFADKLIKGFNEVHRSNMTKLHDGKVVKDKNGKVVKPSTFEPPKLKKILWT